MKQRVLFLLVALFATSALWAYDFIYNGLYYNITSRSDKTVEVTYHVYGDKNYEYLAFANIPTSVTNNDTTYSVTSIGKDAFDGCAGLTSITIPNSVTSIGDSAFCNCTSLTSVTIPNSVTEIGWNTFRGCTSLTSITIPNSVTSVGYSAFEGCTSLATVTIGDGVTNIKSNLFAGCIGLTSIVVNDKNTTYDSRNDCNAIIETKSNTLIVGCQATIIPNSVKSIGYGAFSMCIGLISITIPNSVTSIGSWAFEHCTGLASITIGNGVTSIERATFYGCKSLTSVTIPHSVTSIGESAFGHCTSLTSVNIGNGVTSIGRWAFGGCSSLHNIRIMAQNPPICSNLGLQSTDTCYVPCGTKDVYEAVRWGGLSRFHEGAYRVSILPNDVNMGEKIVGEWMCIEDSITATPKHGYQFIRWSDGNTDNPRAVSLTCDTTFVAEFAQTYSGKCGDDLYWRYEDNTLFITGTGDMCNYSSHSPWSLFTKEIQSVVFDKGVTSISNNVFAYCTSLRQVSLGDSLRIIGSSAFAYCSSLSSICLPNALTIIENSAFYGCTSLTNVIFGTSLQKINGYAFGRCNHLTNIELPNNLPSVGCGAFLGCTALGKVVLGKGLTSIEKSAFEKCNKLYDIYCYAIEPPAANTNSFSNYNVYLHVPCENLRNYQLDVLFGSFKYIECIGSDNVDSDGTIVVTPGNNEVEIT